MVHKQGHLIHVHVIGVVPDLSQRQLACSEHTEKIGVEKTRGLASEAHDEGLGFRV